MDQAINDFLDYCNGKTVKEQEAPDHAKVIKTECLAYGDLLHFADGSTVYHASLDTH